MAVVLAVHVFQVIRPHTTITPGDKAQVVREVLGVMPVATPAHALLGTTPIRTVHGITLLPEVLGVILRLAIHPLVAPVAVDSPAAEDSVVAVVAIAVVAVMEDDKIIRSSFYSI